MLPDIRPGNTKILYFFNCLLDGMHTILFTVCVSLSCRNPELFLLPPRNSIFSAFLQLMSVNQVHDQDNKNNCD